MARKSVKGGWCPELGYSTATCVLERSECPNDRYTPHLCFLFLKCLPFEECSNHSSKGEHFKNKKHR